MTKPIAATLIAVPILLFAFLGASPAPDPAEAARLNNLGVAHMNQQLFEKALKAFEEAAAKDPALRITTLNRGVALLNLQKVEEAKALLEKASKDDPADAHAWYNLGLYYKNSASPDAALGAFRRVTEIDPNDADTWYFLGSTYAQLKQFPEAIAAFEHALKIDPLHASAQFGLARAYQQSGQTDPAHEAMKRFQYVTQKKLGSPISLIYGEQGKYSRAEESAMAVQKVPAQIAVRFVDVTKKAGIVSRSPSRDETNYLIGPGACFIDYDSDGLPDIFFADGGTEGGMSLYHNLGGGKFEDVTKKAGLNPLLHGVSCTAGDYDNDGAPDLVVRGSLDIALLHNEKNGTFKDVTESAGITNGDLNKLLNGRPAEPGGVVFIDYDHDGDLDLYVTNDTTPPYWSERIPTAEKTNGGSVMWRNNGNGTFTDVTESTGLKGVAASVAVIGTDFNNDRAVDLVTTGEVVTGGIVGGAVRYSPIIFENPREGKFRQYLPIWSHAPTTGVAVLDFNHDGWMDLAFTHDGSAGITLWRNNQGKTFDQVPLPKVNWVRGYGVVAIDYDNDGWVDLAAVGETKDGRGEVRLFRNLGPDGWKDVTVDVGLDKIQLKEPRAIIAGDFDNDGAVDLLITQNHGPAVLLRNEGGNKNNSLRLALKGLNDNKSAIGTKVEVFSDGIRQKFEVYGSSGYLGQNSPYLTIGLGQAKQADVVRLLWPTGVLQDEIEVAANKLQNIQELDRRGSSCPTLFAWDGTHYALVGDMLGAGVVGHWIAAGDPQGLKPQSLGAGNGTAEVVSFPKPTADDVAFPKPTADEVAEKLNLLTSAPKGAIDNNRLAVSLKRYPDTNPSFSASSEDVPYPKLSGESRFGVVRNIPRPTEAIKIDRNMLRERYDSHPSQKQGRVGQRLPRNGMLSFRFMEPLEESVYLDQVQLLAVDHPADFDVYPNEYFASNPPYPAFKVVFSRDARPPAGAWDEHGHNVLPDLLAHRYVGDFKVLPFLGFTEPHSLELDLGEPYRGGPLWLLMHGEIEYFSANSMYAADQAGLRPYAPYVEALSESPARSSGAVPRRLKPQNISGSYGAAEEAAEEVEMLTSAPKGAIDSKQLAASLKQCPDTKPNFSASCEAGPFQSRDAQVSATQVSAQKTGANLGHPAFSDTHEAASFLNVPLQATEKKADGNWVRVVDDLGFPAGGARTMTADLTGKLPRGTRRIRLTTNLQIYWDSILINRTSQVETHGRGARASITAVPLARADLSFHGFPLKIEDQPPGNVKYIYEKTSATGPYTRPAGAYTRYGDVLPLLTAVDDEFAVFGSGDEIALDFDPARLPALPVGWVRDYFFIANGYEKDMDFYAYRGDTVEPLPFRGMNAYPYPEQFFPSDADHLNYLLEYNTRFMSGNEARGYSFQYP